MLLSTTKMGKTFEIFATTFNFKGALKKRFHGLRANAFNMFMINIKKIQIEFQFLLSVILNQTLASVC